MINIEIINDKIAIIKINTIDSKKLYTYEVFGDKGYNLSGKLLITSGKFPNISFEYNKDEYYFIKIIEDNKVSYSKFFNPKNKNNINTDIFIKNISMKIEKSKNNSDDEDSEKENEEEENEEDNEEEDNEEEDNDEEEDIPEIISLEDIQNL